MVGFGLCLVNCDIGCDVVIGVNCVMYDVCFEDGMKVENGIFMCIFFIMCECFLKCYCELGDDEIDDFLLLMFDCMFVDDVVEFVIIVMVIDDEVKLRISSILCGVLVRDAID